MALVKLVVIVLLAGGLLAGVFIWLNSRRRRRCRRQAMKRARLRAESKQVEENTNSKLGEVS